MATYSQERESRQRTDYTALDFRFSSIVPGRPSAHTFDGLGAGIQRDFDELFETLLGLAFCVDVLLWLHRVRPRIRFVG